MSVTSTSNSLIWPIRILLLMLVAVLSYVMVKIIITVTNPESVWQTQSSSRAVGPVASAVASRSFKFQGDPYNTSTVEIDNQPVVLNEDVPETTLNLKMTGRISGEKGSAILRTADNKEKVYKIDEEVISDVILKAVNKDFVVLSVNGQLQRLTFEKTEDIGLSKVEVPSFKTQTIPNLSNPQDVVSLLQAVSLRRSIKNGKVQGYTVKANKPGLNIAQFGFEKGDIITSVDGKDLTQGSVDFLTLFQEAAQKGQSELTVIRNGQTRTIKLGKN